jgi:hypothetical protein
MRPDPAEVPSQIIAVTDVHYQEDQATAQRSSLIAGRLNDRNQNTSSVPV